MSREYALIQNTPRPATRQTLAADLRLLGITQGITVLVHTSLSSLGWVNGGAVALIQALMDAVGETGTLAMPAHSGNLSEPSYWCNPPVPMDWQQTIRDTMPAYEPVITPTSSIGVVPELFRKFPGVLRSGHPAVSFCAWGRQAALVTGSHTLEYSLGEGSPLARLYEIDCKVLQLGTDFGHNTSLHLAEYRTGIRNTIMQGAPMLRDGHRIWQEYRDLDIDNEEFDQIGQEFEASYGVTRGVVAMADCLLMSQRQLVDFACQWFRDKSHEG